MACTSVARLSCLGLALLAGSGVFAKSGAQTIGLVASFEGQISPIGNFNSTGASNSVTIVQTGLFQVVMPGLGNGLNSDVQVNAYNSDGRPHYCMSQGWGSNNGVDVVAYVGCYDLSGNPLSADFSLLYQSRTVPPGGNTGFVWADQPTASSYTPASDYSFNSSGGTNTITRQGVGNYVVTLPGLRGGGNPQVTAYGSTAAHCEVASWTKANTTASVNVLCFNPAGSLSDGYFDLSYTYGVLQTNGTHGADGIYVFANRDGARSYVPHNYFRQDGSLNITATRFGPLKGQYSLQITNPDNRPFTTLIGFVTPVGTQGEICDVDEYDVYSGGFDMDLACYTSSGIPLNTQYSGDYFFNFP